MVENILLKCGCIIRTTGCRYQNRWKKLNCCNPFLGCWLHFSLAMSDGCGMDFSLGSKCPPQAGGEFSHNLAHDEASCYGTYSEIPSSAYSGQLLIKFFLTVSQMFHIDGLLWSIWNGSWSIFEQPLKTERAPELKLSCSFWLSQFMEREKVCSNETSMFGPVSKLP